MLRCKHFSVDAIAASKAGVAFLATPHDVSAELAPGVSGSGITGGGFKRSVSIPFG